MTAPDRITLPGGLNIPRLITGLWQVADMERGGTPLDPDRAAADLARYAQSGFDAFDMADHYGSAELITGRFLAQHASPGARAFTKWCPEPGPMTPELVRAGVEERRQRLGVACIDLLQFHWWDYRHPAYLDAFGELVALQQEGWIAHLGLTNFDTDHLRLLRRHGVPVVTNQVSFSLLDRRAAGRMSEFCLTEGVRLLAYGTLAGGFLADRWVGQPEPEAIGDWSKNKYKRFIDAIGGWSALQAVLQAASQIGRKHGVSVSAVALRWVLEQPAVAAAIVGARLGEREHRDDNLAAFRFALDAQDHVLLQAAFDQTRDPPGDCGDEYRKPPFLTASGDLSHHLSQLRTAFQAEPVPGRPGRWRVDSGSRWEPIGGYARAVRQGSVVRVSGTTATHGNGQIVCPGDAEAQTVYILDKIGASLQALGAGLDDVVRTRVYLRDADAWDGPTRVHGRVFGQVRPANTLIGGIRLIGDYEVEIEAEAEVLDLQERRFISSGSPWEAIAGYSRAVVEGDWVFVSGTVGFEGGTGRIEGDAAQQARRAIDHIEAALQKAQATLRDVVRVVVYVSDRADVPTVSEVVRERLGPARAANTTVCSPLAVPECKVEIEVTARRRGSAPV